VMRLILAWIFLVITALFDVEGKKTVRIESFEKGASTVHSWFELNDPVMGGLSTGTFTVRPEDGIGVLDGEVRDVPKLAAPGFIAMGTRGGFYPDISSCDAFRLKVRSTTSYTGYRVSFGVAPPPNNAESYSRGYKGLFDVFVVNGDFSDIFIPFHEFSNYWDLETGDAIVSCSQNEIYCPDKSTLENIHRFEIMAQGVLGEVHLEVKSIEALNCDDDVNDDVPENMKQEDNWENDSSPGYVVGQGISHGATNNNNNAIILGNGDISIESFANPRHDWFPLNDPVMGGKSVSKVEINEGEFGLFEGRVMDVPSLGVPGFIKMETRGGYFPDVSSCQALRLRIKWILPENYDGWFVSFGTHHRANAKNPYIRGYKAHFQPKGGGSQDVVIPFQNFSDNWDPNTGKVVVSCSEDPKTCVDKATLKDMTVLSIMGEGANGILYLEIEAIDAIQCTHHDDSSKSLFANTFNNFVLWGAIVMGIFSMIIFIVQVEHRHHRREGMGDSIQITTAASF